MKAFQYQYEDDEQLRNQIHEEMKSMFVAEKVTVEDYEKIMLLLIKQLLPFLETILKFDSMEVVRDLLNAFPYIEEHRKEGTRPLTGMEAYIELCNDAGLICGECEESERYSEDEIMKMQQHWYDEREEMDSDTNIIAHYAFSIFGGYYYFLNYFADEEPDLESAKELCEDMVEEILFDILWEMDFDLGRSQSESYCLKAIREVFS